MPETDTENQMAAKNISNNRVAEMADSNNIAVRQDGEGGTGWGTYLGEKMRMIVLQL